MAKVTTSINHGYADYEVVTISQVSNATFNGTFAIMGASGSGGQRGGSSSFHYRLKALPASSPS
ncbi:MAG TPA: hypothetical protein VNU68_05595 [Verrucomicrobiae bacterium]|nr:hypothetical protein [Verrucomicrobiae bacterium]